MLRLTKILPIALLLMVTLDAWAELSKSTTGNPAFRGTIVAIANLNRAMREAAENPQDTWRRDAVRAAVNGVSFAVTALGAAYGSHALDSKDYPAVKAMLGGFVDVSAPDNYNKFLVSPDKRYIPRVGAGFPDKMDAADSGGASGGGSAPTSFGAFRSKAAESHADPSKIGLKDAKPDEPLDSKSDLSSKNEVRLGYDDNAKTRTGSSPGGQDNSPTADIPPREANRSPERTGEAATGRADSGGAVRDLALVEVGLKPFAVRAGGRPDEREASDFFEEKKSGSEARTSSPDPRKKLLVAKRRSSLRPRREPLAAAAEK